MGDVRNRLPDPGAGFIWEEARHGCGTYPLLRPLADACSAAYTTRIGGVSLEPFDELNVSMSVGDGPHRVLANRDLAARPIGGNGLWSTVKQVHGSDVIPARRHGRHRSADGQWTDEPGMTLGALAADCVLVLLIGPMRIGVAHAGWRGLVDGVIEAAVEATEATTAFAGPAIGPCCFEVGSDVVEAFDHTYVSAVVDQYHVDLWKAVETAARSAGVATVACARICTSCHPGLFFSHRRDLGQTGRQALVARIDA
jgi:polyphenol oxidase